MTSSETRKPTSEQIRDDAKWAQEQGDEVLADDADREDFANHYFRLASYAERLAGVTELRDEWQSRKSGAEACAACILFAAQIARRLDAGETITEGEVYDGP